MTPPDWLEFYIITVVHIGAVIAVGAPLDYRRSTWSDTEVGRAQMAKWVCLAALFLISILNFWWPFGDGWWYIYAFVLTAVDAAMLWQWRVLRRIQRGGRK